MERSHIVNVREVVLVCGGRNYSDYNTLAACLNALPFTPNLIIEGGAKGADALAKRYAIESGIHYAEVPALWDTFGKGAGMKRNKAMLLLQPTYCVAFPGGVGTNNMVTLATSINIPIWQPLLEIE